MNDSSARAANAKEETTGRTGALGFLICVLSPIDDFGEKNIMASKRGKNERKNKDEKDLLINMCDCERCGRNSDWRGRRAVNEFL